MIRGAFIPLIQRRVAAAWAAMKPEETRRRVGNLNPPARA